MISETILHMQGSDESGSFRIVFKIVSRFENTSDAITFSMAGVVETRAICKLAMVES